jgi:hypothetical protein
LSLLLRVLSSVIDRHVSVRFCRCYVHAFVRSRIIFVRKYPEGAQCNKVTLSTNVVLPLIEMINGVEEVLILLFTAFRYEYLF